MKQADLRELALQKVKITGDVIGKFGTFEIEQTYLNNTKDVLEVGYTFPIVETATVVGFEIHVGDKVLKGVCKEKEEAKKEYTQNLVKGNSSYLMEQEFDNVFKISVGKIDKNEEVTVKINYIDKFEIVDNTIKILMPTLVTPKYKSTVTENLKYGKVGYTIDFNINIDKKLKRKRISCLSHEINLIDEDGVEKVTVLDYDMSKDFRLEIELKKELLSSAITSKTVDGKDLVYLSFMPEIEDEYSDKGKEFIFIVDTSGSMMGDKMNQTKHAVQECLKQLEEKDKLNIIDFNSDYKVMNFDSVKCTSKNMKMAEGFVERMYATGGTEILEPVKFALDGKSENKIVLLFTDGQVGNENEIIDYVNNNIQSARLFAFGIDTNVNSSFIKNMSRVGGGKAELIMPNQKIDESIIRTFARIQSPLVENLEIDYGESKLEDEIKEESTLFNYEFFNVFALLDELKDDIVLKGTIQGKECSWIINKKDISKAKVNLELIYAKEQIARLDDYIRNTYDLEKKEQYKKMIIELATKHNINSKYTAFITVLERDKKLHDVPKYQETTLSDGFLKGVFDIFRGNDYAQPSMVMGSAMPRMAKAKTAGAPSGLARMRGQAKSMMMDAEDGRIADDMPCDLDDSMSSVRFDRETGNPNESLCNMLDEYCEKYTYQSGESIQKYLLVLLYKIANFDNVDGYVEEFLKFVKANLTEIMEDETLKSIIFAIILKIRNSSYQLNSNELKEVFGEYYSIKFELDFGVDLKTSIDALTEEEIKDIVRNVDFKSKEENAIVTVVDTSALDAQL